jgi:hypothetical protein
MISVRASCPLHILVNNAGIMASPELRTTLAQELPPLGGEWLVNPPGLRIVVASP